MKRFSSVKKLKWKGFIWNEKDSFWEKSTKSKMKRNSSLKWKGFIFEKQNEKKLKRKGFRATPIKGEFFLNVMDDELSTNQIALKWCHLSKQPIRLL